MVNLSHTLHPAVQDVFEQANSEFVERLMDNYNPNEQALFIQDSDLCKIVNTLQAHYHLTDDLRESMMRYITEELDNYEVLAELAVLYATKMDTTY